MSTTQETAVPPDEHRRRNRILAMVGVAQLMVVLDITIVNVAMPSAQEALAFSNDNRQWIVTAYALAFGSLLLLGGRLGDVFGRRNVFVTGLLGFAGASVLGGAAQSVEVLIGARALQGAFGALLAPSALGILAVTFREPPSERARAFAIFGAIAGAGAAIGLLLGGALTELVSWRWCLYVNLLFAVPTALAALRLLPAGRPADAPSVDVAGAILATAGLFALVYGFSNAERSGWGDTVTVVGFAASAVLLGAFVARQRVATHPLLPLEVPRDRTRGGAYLAMTLAGAAIFPVFLFLTYFLQQNLGFTPIQTGLGFLAMTAGIIVAANTATRRLLPRVGPRPLVTAGMLLGAAALLGMTTMTVDSTYLGSVFPTLLVLGLGMGTIFATTFQVGTQGIGPQHAGVASAMVNTSQQVGGSIGTAALSTIAASATADRLVGVRPNPEVVAVAAVHGYSVALAWGAGIFLLGAIASAVLLPGGVPEEIPGEAIEPVVIGG